MAQNILFKPIKDDFRGAVPGHFSYEQIQVKNFDEFEIALNQYSFIDNNYNFIKKYGNKHDLTAIFIFIIEHSYCFPATSYKIHRRNYEFYEYRQYLDHRYNIIPNTKNTYNQIKQIPPFKRDNILIGIIKQYPDIFAFINSINNSK